jgi:hypothetical protein
VIVQCGVASLLLTFGRGASGSNPSCLAVCQQPAGRLGLGGEEDIFVPTIVQSLLQKIIVDVCAGYYVSRP